MKKITCIFILFIMTTAWSGDLDINGYYEPQLSMMHVADTTWNLAANKLRVDMNKDLSDQVSFGANFDYITYHGKTQWRILDYLPDRVTAPLPAAYGDQLVFNFGDMVQNIGPMYVARPDRIFLDNAWVRLSFKRFDLTIGKQQLGMGAGYTWNPTDVFNTKDVLDPTYEQPGHNAVKVQVPLGGGYGILAIYSPGEEWNNSVKLLKLKGRLGHFDYSVMGVQKHQPYTDYYHLRQVDYKREMIGGDLVGELFGLGVWAEGGYNRMTADSDYSIDRVSDHWECIAGADYTFESGLYLMGEYYYNDMLPAEWEKYDLNDWMWMFTAETKSLSRDQFSGLIQYPATDLLTIGLSSIISVNDQSTALVPMIIYSVFQDVELTVLGNVFTGKEGRTYSPKMGNGGMARLRVYF